MSPRTPQLGDLVKVHAYTTPGHERPSYTGRVVSIGNPDARGFVLCTVESSRCPNGRSANEWLHHMSVLIRAEMVAL